MKNCPYCGKEYQDEAAFCSIDGTRLAPEADSDSQKAPVIQAMAHREEISPQEKSFWANMGFREFAVFVVRLQAIWLLFYAALDATYVLRYFIHLMSLNPAARSIFPGYREEIFWAFLRMMMNIAAGVWLIQKSERFLSWLIKDRITPAPSKSDAPSEMAPDEESRES